MVLLLSSEIKVFEFRQEESVGKSKYKRNLRGFFLLQAVNKIDNAKVGLEIIFLFLHKLIFKDLTFSTAPHKEMYYPHVKRLTLHSCISECVL